VRNYPPNETSDQTNDAQEANSLRFRLTPFEGQVQQQAYARNRNQYGGKTAC